MIRLENNNGKKDFFYILKENGRSAAIKMQMKNKNTIEIGLPKKSIFNSLSLKLFSAESFIIKNKTWIFKISKNLEKQENKIPLSDKEWKDRKSEFLKIAKERVDFFNSSYGFKYKNIFIKDTKSRWGSCSSIGNLNFNYRIFMLDSKQRDYIIVHELCHLKEMNHGKNFWNLVEKKSPEYKKVRKSLKEYNFAID